MGLPLVYVGLTDLIHKITSDWNIETNTTSFVRLLSIEDLENERSEDLRTIGRSQKLY